MRVVLENACSCRSEGQEEATPGQSLSVVEPGHARKDTFLERCLFKPADEKGWQEETTPSLALTLFRARLAQLSQRGGWKKPPQDKH